MLYKIQKATAIPNYSGKKKIPKKLQYIYPSRVRYRQIWIQIQDLSDPGPREK